MAVHIKRDGEMEVTYEGRVLGLREYNGYDDSDFYAKVWDDEAGKVREVEYATTRGWTYDNSATVDADEATLTKYEAWLTARNFEAAEARFLGRMHRVERGRLVTLNRAVRSRKNGAFEKGESGRVFWLGADRYSYSRDAERAGVEFEDGRKHFFSTLDLTGVTDEEFDAEAAREYAAYTARAAVESVRKVAERNRARKGAVTA